MRTIVLRSVAVLIVSSVTGLGLPAGALASTRITSLVRTSPAVTRATARPLSTPVAPLTAGTNIGNATQLTGTGSGSIASGSDDWWVIYPAAPGKTVSVTVVNNAPASAPCSGIAASLDGTDGAKC